MDADIEEKIRSRIETILLNDARNHAELKLMAGEEDPFAGDPYAEERNLYQRIISSYRNAVGEVNGLLEEIVGFMSGFYRIVETIKDSDRFQEICSRIVDCVLQDLGVEYCSLVFRSHSDTSAEPQYHEGIREQRKFLYTHVHATLLGSSKFEQIAAGLAEEADEFVNIGDVYRESRFNSIDFPSVVRSLVCLPIRVRQANVGALILGHSMPRYFTPNHLRVLKILASMIAHLRYLTAGRDLFPYEPPTISPKPVPADAGELLSLILLNFDHIDSVPNPCPDMATMRSIRAVLASTLREGESILLYDENEFLILLPGVAGDRLAERVTAIQEAFEKWKTSRSDRVLCLLLNVGYATCDEGEDLTHTLEAASLMMRRPVENRELTIAGRN